MVLLGWILIVVWIPAGELCAPTGNPIGNDGPITSSPSFHMSYSPPIEWTFADTFNALKKTKRDIQQQFVWKPMEVNVQEDIMESSTGSTETPETLPTEQELTTTTKPEVTTPPPKSTTTLPPSNATTTMVKQTTTAATTTTAVGPFPCQSPNETAATDMLRQAMRNAINQLLINFGVNTMVPQNMTIDLSELIGQISGIIVKSSGWTMGEGRVVSGAVTDICEAETCSLNQGLPVGFVPFLVGPVKVSVINGPALSMGQWRTIADNMYNMLSINNNVFFEGYITVTDDS